MIIYSCKIVSVYDYFHSNLPKSFDNIFTKAADTHPTFTRHANNGNIVPPRFKSTNYGLKSMYKLCVDAWNKITNDQKIIDKAQKKHDKKHTPIDLHNIPRKKLKQIITNNFFESYI